MDMADGLFICKLFHKKKISSWILLLIAPTQLSCVWPHVSTPMHYHLHYAALYFPMFSLIIRVYPSFHSLVIQSACSSHPFIQYFTIPPTYNSFGCTCTCYVLVLIRMSVLLQLRKQQKEAKKQA